MDESFRILSMKKNDLVIFKWNFIDNCIWATNFYANFPYQIHESKIMIFGLNFYVQHCMELECFPTFCATVISIYSFLNSIVISVNFGNSLFEFDSNNENRESLTAEFVVQLIS